MITAKEQQRAAKEFAKRWKDRGYEKGESNLSLFFCGIKSFLYSLHNSIGTVSCP